MTTIVKQPDVNESNNSGMNEGSAGDNLSKITVGSAALSAEAMYGAMEMYSEILSWNQKAKIDMVEAQSADALGQAHATKEAGKDMMLASMASGAVSILGACIGVATTTKMMQIGEAGEASSKMKATENELTPMNKLDAALAKPNGEGQASDLKTVDDENVEALVQQFRDGDYSNAGRNEAETNQAVKQMKAGDKSEHDSWKKEFKESLSRKEQEFNSHANIINQYSNKANIINGVVSSVAQAGSKVSDGIGGAYKAEEDAKAVVYAGANQMASSAANELAGAANKAFEAQNSEVRVLSEMNQANGANA